MAQIRANSDVAHSYLADIAQIRMM